MESGCWVPAPLTLASSPAWNRDADQVHPCAVRHGPRGAAHPSREQWLQDPHIQPGLCGSVPGAVGVWGLRLGGKEGACPKAMSRRKRGLKPVG